MSGAAADGGATRGPGAPGRGELLYSDYINDRAIVEALRLTPRPAGVPEERWPDVERHEPGGPWPQGGAWCHEEVLFIRTHQAFEVWFALALHELESVVGALAAVHPSAGGDGPPRADLAARRLEAEAFDARRLPHLCAAVEQVAARFGRDRVKKLREMGTPGRLLHPGAYRLDGAGGEALRAALARGAPRLRRAAHALAVTLPFYDVLATMTPAQFLAFRDRLQPASGFGSGQFRELELLLGLRELHADRLRPPPDTNADGTPRSDPDLPAPLLRPTAETPAFLAEGCFVRTLPPWMWPRVARRAAEPSLRDVVYGLLATTCSGAGAAALRVPVVDAEAVDRFAARVVVTTMDDLHRGLPPGALDPVTQARLDTHLRDVDAALAHRETIAAARIEMLAEDGEGTVLRDFLEACRQVDGAVLAWRDRHIRFVEGIIGIRRGTGGGGLRYLRATVDAQRETYLTHGLPALWQARTFVG